MSVELASALLAQLDGSLRSRYAIQDVRRHGGRYSTLLATLMFHFPSVQTVTADTPDPRDCTSAAMT